MGRWREESGRVWSRREARLLLSGQLNSLGTHNAKFAHEL